MLSYTMIIFTVAAVFAAVLRLSAALAPLPPSRADAASKAAEPESESDVTGGFLDVPRLKQAIYSGRVFQQDSFLTERQVLTVLDDIAELEANGAFERKGLSNTSMKKQTFTRRDRTICVVPWFIRAIEGSYNDGDGSHGEHDGERDGIGEIGRIVSRLHRTLQKELGRPTIGDTSLSHECYYSKSEIGSGLPRHMDEKHEELKGAKGWLMPSRRSLSWLIYLGDADWDVSVNGGALRSYPQQRVEDTDSTDDGNLLVGWLLPRDGHDEASQPVYMDSWYETRDTKGTTGETTRAVDASDGGSVAEPHCILYTIDRDGDNARRKHVTRPWLNDGLQGVSPADFVKAWSQHDSQGTPSLFVNAEYARRFVLVEDRATWDEGLDPAGSEAVDIVPRRGSLVVFDSVMVPHEVSAVKNGTRVALAGWFHEATQECMTSLYG